MSEKTLNNIRIVHKHDTEENWLKATNFIPKQGELIIYDIDNKYNYERMKIGDGNTLVNNLPFIIKDQIQSDWNQNDESAKDHIKNRPFYANTSSFRDRFVPSAYEEVDSSLLKVISSNSAIREIKNKIGADINVPTDDFVFGKQLDIIITNEKQEEKVVSIDNPCYIVGVTDNGYPFLRFCHKDKMPIYEYRIEENDLVYHYVYNYFAVGALYSYGISSSEWGYNPSTGVWLGTEYIFNFTVENVVKLDEKYIPEIISRTGHTHLWNDLEDKPFNKVSFEEIDCVYDPNNANNVVNTNGEKIWYLGDHTYGNEGVRYITDSNGRIYKVPFNKVSSYLYKATFNLTGGNEITIYNILLASGGTIDGIIFPSGGTYATAPLFEEGLFITKIEYAIYDTLYENYIPDSIARTADVNEKIITVEEKLNNYYLKTEADTLHTEIENYVDTSIANLVNSAPDTLDTLGELATAFSENKEVVDALDSAISNKVDIAQGVENAGKILSVDEEGNVALNIAPEAMGIVYDEADKVLEFTTKPQLSGNVSVDSTLTVSGDAADSKVVGDKFAELEEKIENGAGSTGGNGIANWDQNNETGEGYIQNRPFYMTREPSEITETVEVLPETSFEFEDEMYMGAISFPFEVGAMHTVVFDGTSYEMECQQMNVQGMNIVYLGGVSAQGPIINTYPFCIQAIIEQGTMAIVVADGAEISTHTFAISKVSKIVDLGEVKFEDKYITHLQVDWNNEDKSSIGFIKNKPFGDEVKNIELVQSKNIFEEMMPNIYACAFLAGELLEENKEYKVIFDNQEYILTPYIDENIGPLLGAIDVVNQTFDFSEYPFVIMIEDDDGMYSGQIITELSGDHTFSISTNKMVITKLSEKYQNQSDWAENDETKGIYIANKPFGEYFTGNTIELASSDGNPAEFENVIGSIFAVKCQIDRPLIEGGKYKVTIGSSVYDNVFCYYDEMDLVLGANEAQMVSNSGEYPFMLIQRRNIKGLTGFYVNNYDGSPFLIEEYEMGIKQIDEKYLPFSNSWNDLKDKPFEEFPVTRVGTTYMPIGQTGGTTRDITYRLQEGVNYLVKFDGVEYDTVGKLDDEGYVYIGGTYEDNTGDYPFKMTSTMWLGEPSTYIQVTNSGVTIELYEYKPYIKQIEEKYIPDTIARVDQLGSTDDLSNYYTKSEIDAKFDEYVNEIDALIGGDI